MSQNGYGGCVYYIVCVCLFLLWSEGGAEGAAAAFPCGPRRHASQDLYRQEEEEKGKGRCGIRRRQDGEKGITYVGPRCRRCIDDVLVATLAGATSTPDPSGCSLGHSRGDVLGPELLPCCRRGHVQQSDVSSTFAAPATVGAVLLELGRHCSPFKGRWHYNKHIP